MFTDKYKPQNFENFVGNTSKISVLQSWLDDWKLHQQKKINKCALISGQNGIGKTLCVELFIKKNNLNPIFINPDEKADKEYFQEKIIPIIQIEKSITLKRNVIVVHDIDCYDDYGFITNIVHCMKESNIPLIATCNNRYDQSLKPIIAYCLDVKFLKPNSIEVMKFITPIIKTERLSIPDYSLKNMIEDSNCDIRNILVNLQMGASLATNYIKDKNITETSIFDLTKSFMSQNIDIKEKYTLFWLNHDLLPLMIHENYPLNNIKMKDDIKYLQNISDSVHCLSDIDLIDHEIRSNASNWELLPYIACNSIKSVSNCHAKTQIKFTEFLGKIASRNKNKNRDKNDYSMINIKETFVATKPTKATKVKEPKTPKTPKPQKSPKQPKVTKVKEPKQPKQPKATKVKEITASKESFIQQKMVSIPLSETIETQPIPSPKKTRQPRKPKTKLLIIED
jgi:DNA polymerase III delta prime subunit